MRVQHREHYHVITLDDNSDDIITVDGKTVHEGYVTRNQRGELICCLPESTCDKE